MAHVGTAPIIDRIVALFRQELNAEVGVVDTAANVVAAASDDEHVFVTEDIADEDIEGFTDRQLGSTLRVVVFEGTGRTYGWAGQAGGGQRAIEGLPTTLPRLDIEHALIVRVRAKSASDTWSASGAYRRVDRVSTAAVALLCRYPRLSVPAPASLSPLVMMTTVSRDGRTNGVQEQDALLVARDIPVSVRTLETR
jgi:hypothetical protein